MRFRRRHLRRDDVIRERTLNLLKYHSSTGSLLDLATREIGRIGPRANMGSLETSMKCNRSNSPFSRGGHVKSQGNKSFFFARLNSFSSFSLRGWTGKMFCVYAKHK